MSHLERKFQQFSYLHLDFHIGRQKYVVNITFLRQCCYGKILQHKKKLLKVKIVKNIFLKLQQLSFKTKRGKKCKLKKSLLTYPNNEQRTMSMLLLYWQIGLSNLIFYLSNHHPHNIRMHAWKNLTNILVLPDTRTFYITNIIVPSFVDVKDVATLSCSYNLGNQKLNSVKWYKNDKEFYR